MNYHADGESFEGDPPAAAEPSVLADRKALALVAVERTRMPMVVTDPRQPDNPIVLANAAFLQLTGYGAEEVIGRNCRFLQGPETDPADIDTIRKAVAGHPDPLVMELLNYRKDGSAFWNQLMIDPVINEAGELIYYFASQRDVTARRRAEEMEATEKLLLKEVDHRAMNALALVQSIVNLSNAETATSFAASVRGRVHSLALAHRLLAEASWAGADLRKLLLAQTPAAYHDRFVVNGCAITLPPPIVQPLALVLHEMTANAVQHGAFAQGDGTIDVDWISSEDNLVLRWCEAPSQMVTRRNGAGVGLRLLEGIVERQLNGRVSLSWRDRGLVVQLTVPMSGAAGTGRS